jgi:hypothetical protein
VSGYEPTASSSDPLFSNPANLPTGFTGTYGVDMVPNWDGFSLLKGSPGINRGMALSSDFDRSINSIRRPAGDGWDIGAYEHNPERSKQ